MEMQSELGQNRQCQLNPGKPSCKSSQSCGIHPPVPPPHAGLLTLPVRWTSPCHHGWPTSSSRVSCSSSSRCCTEGQRNMSVWHCPQQETLPCFGARGLSGHVGYCVFWIVTTTLKDAPIFWSQMNVFCSSSSLMPISSTINKLGSWSSLASLGWFMSSACNKSCWSFLALDSLQHCN